MRTNSLLENDLNVGFETKVTQVSICTSTPILLVLDLSKVPGSHLRKSSHSNIAACAGGFCWNLLTYHTMHYSAFLAMLEVGKEVQGSKESQARENTPQLHHGRLRELRVTGVNQDSSCFFEHRWDNTPLPQSVQLERCCRQGLKGKISLNKACQCRWLSTSTWPSYWLFVAIHLNNWVKIYTDTNHAANI